MKLLEFFSESNGQLSNIRLNATALIFTGCFLAVYTCIQNRLDANVISMATLLVTLGLGGKLIQKPTEEKP